MKRFLSLLAGGVALYLVVAVATTLLLIDHVHIVWIVFINYGWAALIVGGALGWALSIGDDGEQEMGK